MRKRRVIVIAGIALAVLVVVGLGFYLALDTDFVAGVQARLDSRRGVEADPPQPADAPRPGGGGKKRVMIVKPTSGGGSRTTTEPASVHSFGIVDLFAKVSGYLADQRVDIGDPVTASELLARIDAPEITAAADRATAMVEKASVNVKKMEATVSARQADLKAARAKAEQAEAELESYRADVEFRQLQYKRIKSLAELKSIEWELVDEQDKQLKVAQSNLRSGEKALATAKAQAFAAEAAIKQAEASLSDAEAEVKVAQADLAAARQDVDYMSIKAPFDGVVTKRYFYDGDFVRSATGGGNIPNVTLPVLRVARTDKMRVVVRLPDRDVPYADRGDSVTISVDSLPGESFSGKISRMARAEEYDTRYMRVEVDLQNPDGRLEDGMYGNATIVLETERPGVRIPSSCLVGDENQGARSVFVVEDDKAVRRQVRIGADDGRLAQILSGLSTSDRVITGQLGAISDGMPVEVVDTAKARSRRAPRREVAGKPSNQEQQRESVASREEADGRAE